jgi:hypothetical protein
MEKPAEWLLAGIGILAADLIVRHLTSAPGIVHNIAFVFGGAAILWGITKQLTDR